VRPWTFLRVAFAIAWLGLTVRIAIPDYPYDSPLWYSLCMDPNGFWHEAFYVFVGFVCLITLTYFWEERSERIKGFARVRRLRTSK